MCTAILLHRVSPSHPVVVAGNRDEWIARAALAPHVWTVPGGGPAVRIFAGKDRKEGGTWFGVNQHGLVVGVTNRYTGTRAPDRASRGQLVLRCLAQDSIERVLPLLTPEEASRYNPFNLFCLSEEAGVIVTHDDHRFRTFAIERGLHVLTNRAPNDPLDAKGKWLRSRLNGLPTEPDALSDRISQVLAAHAKGDAPPPVCVHLPGYGTVSSFMLFLSSRRDQSRYLYAAGHPCQNPFEDVTERFLPVFSQERKRHV
jgi:uncharacterized protein with NRDE domain